MEAFFSPIRLEYIIMITITDGDFFKTINILYIYYAQKQVNKLKLTDDKC